MGKFADWRKRRAQKRSTSVVNNVVIQKTPGYEFTPVPLWIEHPSPAVVPFDNSYDDGHVVTVDCDPDEVATSYPSDHVEVCEPVHVEPSSYSEPGHSYDSGSSYDSSSSSDYSSSSSSYDSGSSYSSSSYDSGSSSSYDSGSSGF